MWPERLEPVLALRSRQLLWVLLLASDFGPLANQSE
jgi:hypothetical protein